MIAEYLTLQQLIPLFLSNHHLKHILTPLRNKLAVQPKGSPPRPALIWATWLNHESLVRLLLSPSVSKRYAIDTNIRQLDRDTVLHIAAGTGHENIARLLLENGADINALGRGERTPLSTAASFEGHDTVALLLLEMGADPTIGNVLYKARENCNDEVIVLLLKKLLQVSEAAPSMKSWWSQDSFANGKLALTLATSVGDDRMVEYLLEMGVDANTLGNNEDTALHRASSAGHERVVRVLLDGHAAVDSRDDTGWTPLLFAARFAFVDIVRLLLERGADVNALNECEVGALHWAAQNSSEQAVRTVELLLEKGADVQVQKGIAEDTPLGWALEFGKNERVIAMLLSRKQEVAEGLQGG